MSTAIDEEATTDAAATAPADGDPSPLIPKVPRADRFSFGDLLAEATADIGTRPARLVMTILGTVLGIGALVATLGFAQTAAGQIARQFDAVAATQVEIEPASARTASGSSVATSQLPWDAAERVARLVGVESAALVGEADLGDETITAVPVNDPSAAAVAPPPLFGATADLLDVVGARLVTGRMFDSGHEARGDRVAVLGARAAERLGVNRVDSQPSIFVAGLAYAVIGIFDEPERRADLRDAVVIPLSAAQGDVGLGAAEALLIRIVPGAGPQVAEQAVVALAPDAPDSFDVSAPAGRSDLSSNVQSDVNVVFLILGAIVLLAGGLGIANVTMLTVMERTPEIGLRRALGATGRQIAAQFVVESVVIGFLGGLIGASLGVLAVVGVSLAQQWTPIVDPLVAVGGALLGALVGLVAGGIPARRAARIEPVAALRSG